MPDIVLTTLNARYIHAAVGLRYLHANLKELKSRAEIIEFEISQDAKDIVDVLLERDPKIIGFGVYIWNVQESYEVISILRRIRPAIVIILGGPEVSYEWDQQKIVQCADYLVTGEADLAIEPLCSEILSGNRPSEKVIRGGIPELAKIELPYDLYSENDLKNRVLYFEASRGCPFTCEFCLSSVDIPVRQFDIARVLTELEGLYNRGARNFKFVDRTFNLNIRNSAAILEFFLARMVPGMFVHFEMVPDRFPRQLRELVAKFPAGSLQFEVGIQSFNPHVGQLISRKQNIEQILENLTYLRQETGVYIHADLIAGLPGETIESFANGFDQLIKANPHEIQVGILKRLRGTPIIRHDKEWGMVYGEHPPYEVLQTSCVDFNGLQKMRMFARFWDLISNSGNFQQSRLLLWQDEESPFWAFMKWSEWLFAKVGRRSSINLKSLSEYLFEYLWSVKKVDQQFCGTLIAADYVRGGRSDLPITLKPYKPEIEKEGIKSEAKLKRQRRTYSNMPEAL